MKLFNFSTVVNMIPSKEYSFMIRTRQYLGIIKNLELRWTDKAPDKLLKGSELKISHIVVEPIDLPDGY